MNKRKIFWHEAHLEALKLELHQYRDALSFISEHQLCKESLIMDVLIIKKDPDISITKNIGRIFRIHNIVEFKSERDSLSVRDYNKVLAYALLYSSFERVPLTDITITFSLTIRPRKLLDHLRSDRGLDLHSASEGITYIHGDILPVQILESKKLPEDENLFLKGLRRGNEAAKMSKILKQYDKLFGLDIRSAYIDRLIQANKDVYREVTNMSQETINFMLDVAIKDGWFAERDAAIIQETARITARETARETARRLLSFGDSIDKIAAATNLTIEEVKDLA